MMNLKEANIIESDALNLRIEAERVKQQKQNDEYINLHQLEFKKMETGKREAEMSLPRILKDVEREIKQCILDCNRRFILYNCITNSIYADMYVVILLIHILTMEGFVVRLDSKSIIQISW